MIGKWTCSVCDSSGSDEASYERHRARCIQVVAESVKVSATHLDLESKDGPGQRAGSTRPPQMPQLYPTRLTRTCVPFEPFLLSPGNVSRVSVVTKDWQWLKVTRVAVAPVEHVDLLDFTVRRVSVFDAPMSTAHFPVLPVTSRCMNCREPFEPPVGLFGTNDVPCPHCRACYAAEPVLELERLVTFDAPLAFPGDRISLAFQNGGGRTQRVSAVLWATELS